MGTLVPWKREREVKRLAGKGPFNQISPPRVLCGPQRGVDSHRLSQLSFSVWHRYVLGVKASGSAVIPMCTVKVCAPGNQASCSRSKLAKI